MQFITPITNLFLMREAPIDLFELEKRIRSFYINAGNFNLPKMRIKIMFARTDLDSSRVLLRNLIDPMKNQYIQDNIEFFKLMNENLGRADKKIEKVEGETLSKLEETEQRGFKLLPDNKFLMRYLNILHNFMASLVVFPLLHAIEEYKKYKKQEIDSELFTYALFRQLYLSSESIGELTSENTSMVRQQTIVNNPKDIESTEEISKKIENQNYEMDSIEDRAVKMFSDNQEGGDESDFMVEED